MYVWTYTGTLWNPELSILKIVPCSIYAVPQLVSIRCDRRSRPFRILYASDQVPICQIYYMFTITSTCLQDSVTSSAPTVFAQSLQLAPSRLWIWCLRRRGSVR